MIHPKSPTFAIFTLNSSNDPENEVVNAISEQAKKTGWNILIFNALDNCDTNRENIVDRCIFRLADPRTLSGAFITQNIMNKKEVADTIIASLKHHNVPVISVGYNTTSCTSIIYDECISFEKMIDHVIEEHGCKVLSLMAGMRNNVFSQNRIDAFKRSLENHGLKFDEKRMYYGEFWRTPTEKAMDDFFASKQSLPDAFICCNDEMAITVCEKLMERKIKIPEDVIVTGYDGIIFSELNSPQISTVKCDDDKLGIESVKLMKKILDGEKVPILKIIAPRPIFSESCGCKPFASHNFNKFAMITQRQIEAYKVMNTMQQNMVTDISNAATLSEIKHYLPDRQYFGGDCWVMLNHTYTDLFYKSTFAISNPFAPKMDCFFCSINWNIYEYPPINKTNYLPEIEKLLDDRFNSIVFTPISFGEEVFGYCAYPFSRDKNTLSKLERFAQTIGQCFALVRNREQMTYMIERDLLTGSYNRRGFYSALKSKIEKLKGKSAYLVIHSVDMDNLKAINDTFGHSAGDFAIKSLARAINSAGGKTAITSRFGGDEFVAAVLTTKKPETFEEDFKSKLAEYLANVNKGSGKPFFVSASCGSQMSPISDFEEDTIDALMKKADNLMYKDKAFRKRNQPRK